MSTARTAPDGTGGRGRGGALAAAPAGARRHAAAPPGRAGPLAGAGSARGYLNCHGQYRGGRGGSG